MSQYKEKLEKVLTEVGNVVVGKEEIIRKVMTAILAGGHILIEDIPGVGKTTMALCFSKAMLLDYRRVQFTPDVLPSDVVGFSVLNSENKLEYKPGAAMCNLFLADEINRTSSKTQSALLEVMEEGNVSVDGKTREVPKPFIVIATQNPINSIGTQMLPESQLDRFMIKIGMGYPAPEQEMRMLKERHKVNPLDRVQQVLDIQGLIELKKMVEEVHVHDNIYAYITNLCTTTRNHPLIELGVSPRGSLSLLCMSKANAFMKGRDYVTPEDVSEVFIDVAAHRLVLSQKAKMSHESAEKILEEIKGLVPKPSLS
ncbi:MAG: MoxR family ATPase [Lachnospiraceae bacterium]|nr:MoxR family ATPase [Lachnospiraceae bacterium]